MAIDDSPPGVQAVEVLGVRVHALSVATIIEILSAAAADRTRLVVGHHNLHSVYLVNERPELRRFYELADIVYIDGMPLVLAARLHGHRVSGEHRMTLLDWLHPLLDSLRPGQRVFLLGSKPGSIDVTSRSLREKHPHLTFLSHHGYFDAAPDSPANGQVIASINAAHPDVLLVGMGMPRQEAWVADNIDQLGVPVIQTVGGLFDYYNGRAGTPPRWMGRLGLEWLYRLADDPRRLSHRYLVEPVLLARLRLRRRRS